MTAPTLHTEATILAQRFCFRPAIVEKWMKANGLAHVVDLMRRYPGKSHADAMEAARAEIFAFVFDSVAG